MWMSFFYFVLKKFESNSPGEWQLYKPKQPPVVLLIQAWFAGAFLSTTKLPENPPQDNICQSAVECVYPVSSADWSRHCADSDTSQRGCRKKPTSLEPRRPLRKRKAPLCALRVLRGSLLFRAFCDALQTGHHCLHQRLLSSIRESVWQRSVFMPRPFSRK